MFKKVEKQVSRELAEIAALFVSHLWVSYGMMVGLAGKQATIIEGKNNKNKQWKLMSRFQPVELCDCNLCRRSWWFVGRI